MTNRERELINFPFSEGHPHPYKPLDDTADESRYGDDEFARWKRWQARKIARLKAERDTLGKQISNINNQIAKLETA